MGAGGSCCRGAGDDERMVAKMDLSHCGCTEVPPIVFQAERYVETLNLSHNRILSLAPQLFHCQVSLVFPNWNLLKCVLGIEAS